MKRAVLFLCLVLALAGCCRFDLETRDMLRSEIVHLHARVRAVRGEVYELQCENKWLIRRLGLTNIVPDRASWRRFVATSGAAAYATIAGGGAQRLASTTQDVTVIVSPQ